MTDAELIELITRVLDDPTPDEDRAEALEEALYAVRAILKNRETAQ